MAASATAIGSTFSNAFSAVLGPLGLIQKGFELLAPLIDWQSEAMKELMSVWEEIKKPITEAFASIMTGGVEYVKSIVDMIRENETLIAVFTKFKEYAASAIQNVTYAVEEGTKVFRSFLAAVQETGQGIVIIMGDVYASIQKTFGIDGIKTLSTWGGAIQTWVIDKIELAGIFVRNWPTFFEIASIQIQGVLMNLGAYIKNFFVSLVDYAMAPLEKLASLFGSQGKFMTALIKDARAELQKMSAPIGDFGKAKLEELYKKIADEEERRKRPVAKAVEPAAETAAAAAAVAKLPGMGFKAQEFGVADLASKMRAGILNKDSDDKMAKQLLAQERTAKAVEKMNEKMDKPKPAVVA